MVGECCRWQKILCGSGSQKAGVKSRKITKVEESYLIREPAASYNTLFEGKNEPLRAENTYLWDLSI